MPALRSLSRILLASIGISAVTAQADDGLDALLADGECPVAERLLVIHGDGGQKFDRYLVLSVRPGDGPNYVQCLFLDDDRSVLCEAASGFYMTDEDEPAIRLSPGPRSELATLGFDVTEPARGNHQQTFTVENDTDIFALADLILTALYRAYGARSISDIEVSAPLSTFPDGLLRPCPALS